MSSRWQDETKQPTGPARLFEIARPVLIGLVAASLVVLTLLATWLLAAQEQTLVSRTGPVATGSPILPSATLLALSAAKLPDNMNAPTLNSTPTALPPTDQPGPSPTASLTASPTPSPTAAPPTASPTLSPTPKPIPTLSPSPSPAPTLQSVETSQPSPDSAAQCKPPSNWHKYRVKNSQTVKSLANYFGTTTSQLKKANCLTGTFVRAGTILWVPRKVTATAKAQTSAKTQASLDACPLWWNGSIVGPSELAGDTPLPKACSLLRLPLMSN